MVAGAPLPLERLLIGKDWTIAQFAESLTPPVDRATAARWVRGQMPVAKSYKDQVDALVAEVEADETICWTGAHGWLALEVDCRRDYEAHMDGRPDLAAFSPSLALVTIRQARATRQSYCEEAAS